MDLKPSYFVYNPKNIIQVAKFKDTNAFDSRYNETYGLQRGGWKTRALQAAGGYAGVCGCEPPKPPNIFLTQPGNKIAH